MGEKGWFRSGALRGQEKEVLLPPEKAQIYMPEGIDFDVLWKDEEPEAGGGIQLILAIVMIVINLIILAVVIFS